MFKNLASWRVAWITTVVLLQFAFLLSMVVYYSEPYRSGQEIVVQSIPVDPRDMFRGRYVTLSYAFNRELPKENCKGRTLYAVMEPVPDSHLWRHTEVTLERPSEGVFLTGYSAGWNAKYGIEQFFAQEDIAKKIDKEMAWQKNQQRKVAEVTLSVLPDGRSAVKDIRLVLAPVEATP